MKPFAWSYSALSGFETCPHQHYRTKVAKDIPDPPGEAALWGQRVHTAFEKRLRDNTPFPDTLKGYEKIAAKFAGLPGTTLVEQQLCLDKGLRPTDWFGKGAWCRSVLDLGVLNGSKGIIVDWKTGKRKPDSEQMALFAGVAFRKYTKIDEFITAFVWLKDGTIDRETYHRKDQLKIWEKFLPRVKRMEEAHKTSKWPKRPSGLCREWCPVRDCEHNGRRS